MALPPFPPFPAAFGPMGAGAGLYRGGGGGGGHLGGGGGGRGAPAAGAMRGGMHRGYDNSKHFVRLALELHATICQFLS